MRRDGARRIGRIQRRATRQAFALACGALLALLAAPLAKAEGPPAGDASILDHFQLPEPWRAEFWASPDAKALLQLGPRDLSELVPIQAGLRYCRCPACGAKERDEPLSWTIRNPKVVTCRFCKAAVPNEKFPAKGDRKEPPEEAVEVVPGVVHHYPYHQVVEAEARYADERLYLQARRDYEARRFLARAALYCAAEFRARPPAQRDPRLSTIACVLMLRFAQVYPRYATHVDQPDRAKILQPSRLRPPLHPNYEMARWEWNGSLEVPANLVVARCLLRGDPAWGRAGELLGEPSPEKTVDRDLFLSAAEMARQQPDDFSEDALNVYRGMQVVGRLLGNDALIADSMARLEGFASRGFYYDGFWRDGQLGSHSRVLAQLDTWMANVLAKDVAVRPASTAAPAGRAWPPILQLARKAEGVLRIGPRGSKVVQASWPDREVEGDRRPILLGAAGLARLAVGEGDNAMDVDLLGQDSFGGPHFQRLALRLAVAGRPMLGDLDESGADVRGWRLATASHNAVVVDGLNQREQPRAAAEAVAGSNFRFFAADPDFQVAFADDSRAYPISATRYAHAVVASAGRTSRYAVSVFEVRGGTQHDQLFHSASGPAARWATSAAAERPPASLLPAGLTFLPSSRPEDGRWFVQAYGEFHPTSRARLVKPTVASLVRDDNKSGKGPTSGLRLHILGDLPAIAIAATSPDPTAGEKASDSAGSVGRASLLIRRRAEDGGELHSVFVSLFEPIGGTIPALVRVGRVASEPGAVVLTIETADGPEHLIVNLEPGKIRKVVLSTGRRVAFDGVALRIREGSVVLAGGTFAEAAGKLVSQPSLRGTIVGSERRASAHSLGWFVTTESLEATAAPACRTLIIEHGDGTSHCWTLDAIEPTAEGTRLHVREEPGFVLGSADQAAAYYQFPQVQAPAPHRFRISMMSR
ncbi:heparinase II/III family protein [Aquisphaera insulae]|uniref:heparinase II/III family protein n=1 Tax=Aquisphaera insulae TaxID=2712864 RepID=UPI0013EAEE98|nr:heparinase II/III family protein [Aquisphaera insulae]